MQSTTTTQSVTRTRTISVHKNPPEYGTRLYVFPSGAAIHVHRSNVQGFRWAAMLAPVVPKGVDQLCVLVERHRAAELLWQNRQSIDSVYEFPRGEARA